MARVNDYPRGVRAKVDGAGVRLKGHVTRHSLIIHSTDE